MQESFDAISFDVAAYFKILERDIDVLGDPKITLYSERDKAVELEIMFGGDPISPAYKFLSESHYQILLFTHDSIWLDRLQRSFPQWIRKCFWGWDYAIGPRIEQGKNSYEQIDELLSQDKPTEAGWLFGRYLEWVLQELCENLEASVKYNRRNEFTLSELVQAFSVRMQKKLTSDHSIVKSILYFESDTGFMNFCDHWKGSETDYSSPEIRDIVQNWRDIESKIECDECHKFIRYKKIDGYEHVLCPCTKLNLKKDEYYTLEGSSAN